jgi:hypothetical protein
MLSVYVASSWRNDRQPQVVRALRNIGCRVYDFRHPQPGSTGFHWSDIDPAWKLWTPGEFSAALRHPAAQRGFALDWTAMRSSDAAVLVSPCGRSAHLEAGYFVGAQKPLFILLSDGEPELMYAMATAVATSLDELVTQVCSYDSRPSKEPG